MIQRMERERLGIEGLVIVMFFLLLRRLFYQISSPSCQAEAASTLRSKRNQNYKT